MPTTPLQIQTVATGLAASAVSSVLASAWTSTTQLTGYRVEAREATGELENQAEAVRTTVVSGTGSNPHPFQTAIVSSLRTATVGPSGRGRLFWPATGVGINNTTLRFNSPTPTALLAAIVTTLGTMQTVIRATFAGANLGVWSRKTTLTSVVTSIQVGDVLDTQRRRRDTLVEAYSTQAFP